MSSPVRGKKHEKRGESQVTHSFGCLDDLPEPIVLQINFLVSSYQVRDHDPQADADQHQATQYFHILAKPAAQLAAAQQSNDG